MAGSPHPHERIEMSTAKRHGEYWEYEDYAELVDRVMRGQTVSEIASGMSRTPSAVQSRLRLMAGLGARTVATGRALDRLAERLDTPSYDWECLLSEYERSRGRHLWLPEDDALLRRGWRGQDPLPVLADWIDVSEHAVVQRLIRLGIAESLVEVVDRLGSRKNGPVAQRYRLAKHSADMTVHVLHVDGLPGRTTPHIEVTFTEEEAHERRDQLLAPVPPDASAGVVWTIAGRVPGSSGRGSTRSETGLDASALRPA